MNKEKISEYNKRCALFLGWKIDSLKCFGGFNYWFHGEIFECETGKEPFHSDWNYIMKVVKKINLLSNIKQKSDTTQSTKKNEIHSLLKYAEKEPVIHAINQFLIWYEKNK